MFIKFTRVDGTPIWLNASFIVTVEMRKPSGAIVVPIGDGLDYEVRESPETVLSLLEGVPPPAVVPVPAPELLTKTPADVSAEPLTMSVADVAPMDSAMNGAPSAATPEAEPAAAPAKAPAKKRASRAKAKKAPAALSDAELERLRKMAPRTVKKLVNTLATQFKAPDAAALVQQLSERGVLKVEQTRVIWQ